MNCKCLAFFTSQRYTPSDSVPAPSMPYSASFRVCHRWDEYIFGSERGTSNQGEQGTWQGEKFEENCGGRHDNSRRKMLLDEGCLVGCMNSRARPSLYTPVPSAAIGRYLHPESGRAQLMSFRLRCLASGHVENVQSATLS